MFRLGNMRLIILLSLFVPTLCFGQGTARHGSSLSFDGANDYVTGTTIIPYDTITVETWMQWTDWLNASSITDLLNYADGLTYPKLMFTWAYQPRFYSGLSLLLDWSATTPTNLLDKKWHHYVFHLNFQNMAKCSLFVDGALQNTAGGANVGTTAAKSSFIVGGGPVDVIKSFNGKLDELRIYHRLIPRSEIAWNYRHPDQPYSRDSLKLWLQMNEYTGVTTADSSGNGNNGTISGATWNIETPVYATKATHGSSLRFGTSGTDNVNTGTGASLLILRNITMECWMNTRYLPSECPNAFMRILWNWDDGIAIFYRTGSSRLEFKLTTTEGSNPRPIVSEANLFKNSWMYITAKYDHDSAYLYINGVEKNAVDRDNTDLIYTNNWYIGSPPGTSLINSFIDNVRFYSRALSSSEIAWNYRHPSQPFSRDSLKLWYQFNEFTGAVAYDSSGNGNNGTITGATWSIETP